MEKINLYLDVSSTNTGVCIENPSQNTIKLSNINLKKLSKPSQMPLVDFQKIKIGLMKEELDSILKDYVVQAVYIEGIFIQPKFLNSSEFLLKIHGFLMGYFMDIPVYYFPPKVIKKFITGNGNASKEDVLRKLNEFYQIQLNDDNQADALALCVYQNNWKTYKNKNKEGGIMNGN